MIERGERRGGWLESEGHRAAGAQRGGAYLGAGFGLVALAAANLHFGNVRGITGPPGPKKKEERAKLAAELFTRAFAKDPEKLLALG